MDLNDTSNHYVSWQMSGYVLGGFGGLGLTNGNGSFMRTTWNAANITTPLNLRNSNKWTGGTNTNNTGNNDNLNQMQDATSTSGSNKYFTASNNAYWCYTLLENPWPDDYPFDLGV